MLTHHQESEETNTGFRNYGMQNCLKYSTQVLYRNGSSAPASTFESLLCTFSSTHTSHVRRSKPSARITFGFALQLRPPRARSVEIDFWPGAGWRDALLHRACHAEGGDEQSDAADKPGERPPPVGVCTGVAGRPRSRALEGVDGGGELPGKLYEVIRLAAERVQHACGTVHVALGGSAQHTLLQLAHLSDARMRTRSSLRAPCRRGVACAWRAHVQERAATSVPCYAPSAPSTARAALRHRRRRRRPLPQ